MAQSGYTPISLYYSTTVSAAPSAGNLVNGELAINITDGKLYYKDNGGVVQLLAAKGGNGVTTFSGGTTGLTPNTATAGAVTLGGTLVAVNGGTGQSSYTTGDLLYASGSTALSKLGIGTNGYILSVSAGVPAWVPQPPSGASIVNDTTTATNLYPLFSDVTTGAPTTIYTSNAKYLYKPSTGDLRAEQLVANNGIVVNNQVIATSYTIGAGYNASSTGPVTVNGGVTVTVSSGSRWVVL